MMKMFEQFKNEEEIKKICEKYKITNYIINPDGSIDVNGGVTLCNKGLDKIPIKFNKVARFFDCSFNELTTLENSPRYIGGFFSCQGNYGLSSLMGGPVEVIGNYNCSLCNLSNLIGCPKIINTTLYCDQNKLTSLEGISEYIKDTLFCNENNITTLKGCPMVIDGNLSIEDNPISIIDSSIQVKYDIYVYDTNFDYKIKNLPQEKLRILFEHGVDYDIFRKDGSVNDFRLERMFKDFNL